MSVPVVGIGEMRMAVGEEPMRVVVRMPRPRGDEFLVGMLVMFIMNMSVSVRKRFMGMQVLVMFCHM